MPYTTVLAVPNVKVPFQERRGKTSHHAIKSSKIQVLMPETIRPRGSTVQELSPESAEEHKAATQKTVHFLEGEDCGQPLAGVAQEEGIVSWCALCFH
jgi:hypothetical protein